MALFYVLVAGSLQYGCLATARLAPGSLVQVRSHASSDAKAGGRDTPVTKVVQLLKEMQVSLQKDMTEDAKLFKELSCWCKNNDNEKSDLVKVGSAKVTELESTIEELSARSSNLKTTIKEAESDTAANRASLDKATAQRKNEADSFHKHELDTTQALENLKAAIVVLGKHQGAAFPQLGGVSLLATGRKDDLLFPSRDERQLDQYVGEIHEDAVGGEVTQDADAPALPTPSPARGFLQQSTEASADLDAMDAIVVRRALRAAAAFAQTRNEQAYHPSYEAQSGEILGVLKQMSDEMQSDLKDSQATELKRAKEFNELRTAKESEIEASTKMEEDKEDEKATTDSDLAEAKEDLAQTSKEVAEAQKFMAMLEKTCTDADSNFAARKEARMEEIKAVAETIEILTADEARDAAQGTFSLLQLSSHARRSRSRRAKAAALLRRVAARTRQGRGLALLASSVELDAFTKVKKAINDMIAALREQQEDEVKKQDSCKEQLQENEMTTMRTTDTKSALEAKSNELGSKLQRLDAEVKEAKSMIDQEQVDLQRATENRRKENLDYQSVYNDQTFSIQVLEKASDRLKAFYSKALLQTADTAALSAGRQAPPVPQAEYKPSKGAGGVMALIAKLIQDAESLRVEAKRSEGEAQAAYEDVVADTNQAIDDLMKEVATKTKAAVRTKKELQQTDSDLEDTAAELEDLGKTSKNLHNECDYILSNFDTRQQARQEETESLQSALRILSGAN